MVEEIAFEEECKTILTVTNLYLYRYRIRPGLLDEWLSSFLFSERCREIHMLQKNIQLRRPPVKPARMLVHLPCLVV